MKAYLLFTFLLVSINSYADTASEIKDAIIENLKFTQSENIEAAMGTLHSQSPSYLPTQQMFQQLFPAYDIKYELIEYHFVGSEGGYAYARIIQRTEKISGPAFQNNEIEALQVFKQENNQWKLWAQANLTISYK